MILADKTLLVTGGTGSLGKVLVRRLLSGELGLPKKVIVLSRDEGKQHDMRLSYLHQSVTTDEVIYNNFLRLLEFRIGDVRDYSDICSALKGVDIVFNAAALKQVPICEYFPAQAVMTNCLGANNIVRAAIENNCNIEAVIGISTDKACKPVNVMGMTKAIQERIFIAANVLAPYTKFICVRYGNVLASRGSVVPLFHEQIARGGPLTITHEKMTRFLLSLEQAVDTVFFALKNGRAGETYVPIAPAATIVDIAKGLIGDRKLTMKVVGSRPGEKLHEIMTSEEEIRHTVKRENYYCILPMLPELRSENDKEQHSILSEEYSSENNVVGFAETVELLHRHGLMPHQVKLTKGEELLC